MHIAHSTLRQTETPLRVIKPQKQKVSTWVAKATQAGIKKALKKQDARVRQIIADCAEYGVELPEILKNYK